MLPHSFQDAILHVDADCFYVSCEVLRRPELRGKPVAVLGKLGGIVLSKSQELKVKGITTGMPVWEAKKLVPNLIALKSDFDWYHECSSRLFALLSKWTPVVEVYSIDEAFLSITGFRRLYRMDYAEIAHAIKEEVKKNLGITVSIGLSVNKTLAKMASEVNKPDGVTVISGKDIASWLPRFKISDVPGFGANVTPVLERAGILTCEDFAALTEDSVRGLLHRPGVVLWKELRGEQVGPLEVTFAPQKMITRTSSFEPLTSNQAFLWSHTLLQLQRGIEALLENHQIAKGISLYLRDKEFHSFSFATELSSATRTFSVLCEALKGLWQKAFSSISPAILFRSSGVTFFSLSPDDGLQLTLFSEPDRLLRRDQLELAKQKIHDRFGNHALLSASALRLKTLGPDKKKPLRYKAFNVHW